MTGTSMTVRTMVVEAVEWQSGKVAEWWSGGLAEWQRDRVAGVIQ